VTSGKQGAVPALSLVLLSGCALVGPDHQTPTTELSAGFANANQPGLSTDPAHTRWWQGFEDQELERLVDLAVAGNHDLRVATARLREARALWDETAFDRYPTVTADAAYSNERRSETALQGFGGADRDRELYNAGFDAFWELDLFGRVRRSIEARAAERDAAEASLHDVLVSLLAEVARNYFELRGTQYQLAVASRNADNQRQTLALTVARPCTMRTPLISRWPQSRRPSGGRECETSLRISSAHSRTTTPGRSSCSRTASGRFSSGRAVGRGRRVRRTSTERPVVYATGVRLLPRGRRQDQVPTWLLGQSRLVRTARHPLK
jgi:Outer membrane efflux protein